MAIDNAKLTKDETECLTYLADAWNAFNQLQGVPSWDKSEFMQAIHRAQSLIAVRVAQRIDPDVWNIGKTGM